MEEHEAVENRVSSGGQAGREPGDTRWVRWFRTLGSEKGPRHLDQDQSGLQSSFGKAEEGDPDSLLISEALPSQWTVHASAATTAQLSW